MTCSSERPCVPSLCVDGVWPVSAIFAFIVICPRVLGNCWAFTEAWMITMDYRWSSFLRVPADDLFTVVVLTVCIRSRWWLWGAVYHKNHMNRCIVLEFFSTYRVCRYVRSDGRPAANLAGKGEGRGSHVFCNSQASRCLTCHTLMSVREMLLPLTLPSYRLLPLELGHTADEPK